MSMFFKWVFKNKFKIIFSIVFVLFLLVNATTLPLTTQYITNPDVVNIYIGGPTSSNELAGKYLILRTYGSSSGCTWASDDLDIRYSYDESNPSLYIDVLGYKYRDRNPLYKGGCARYTTWPTAKILLDDIVDDVGITEIRITLDGKDNFYTLDRTELQLTLSPVQADNVLTQYAELKRNLGADTVKQDEDQSIIVYPDDVRRIHLTGYFSGDSYKQAALESFIQSKNVTLASTKYPNLQQYLDDSPNAYVLEGGLDSGVSYDIPDFPNVYARIVKP